MNELLDWVNNLARRAEEAQRAAEVSESDLRRGVESALAVVRGYFDEDDRFDQPSPAALERAVAVLVVGSLLKMPVSDAQWSPDGLTVTFEKGSRSVDVDSGNDGDMIATVMAPPEGPERTGWGVWEMGDDPHSIVGWSRKFKAFLEGR